MAVEVRVIKRGDGKCQRRAPASRKCHGCGKSFVGRETVRRVRSTVNGRTVITDLCPECSPSRRVDVRNKIHIPCEVRNAFKD